MPHSDTALEAITSGQDHASDLNADLGNRFAELPPAFFTQLMPTPLPRPYPVAFSAPAAALIGVAPDAFNSAELLETLVGNRVLPAR